MALLAIVNSQSSRQGRSREQQWFVPSALIGLSRFAKALSCSSRLWPQTFPSTNCGSRGECVFGCQAIPSSAAHQKEPKQQAACNCMAPSDARPSLRNARTFRRCASRYHPHPFQVLPAPIRVAQVQLQEAVLVEVGGLVGRRLWPVEVCVLASLLVAWGRVSAMSAEELHDATSFPRLRESPAVTKLDNTAGPTSLRRGLNQLEQVFFSARRMILITRSSEYPPAIPFRPMTH